MANRHFEDDLTFDELTPEEQEDIRYENFLVEIKYNDFNAKTKRSSY